MNDAIAIAIAIAIAALTVSNVALLIYVLALHRWIKEVSDLALATSRHLTSHTDLHRRAHVHQQIRNRARTN